MLSRSNFFDRCIARMYNFDCWTDEEIRRFHDWSEIEERSESTVTETNVSTITHSYIVLKSRCKYCGEEKEQRTKVEEDIEWKNESI